ncbi:MAG: AAA family ATPase [Spirochaetales bacterium]|jgi:predicted AAA+ superfamily ATPase|nr:AAA family ATPase [Spirochaetales bacterium]
MEEVTEQSNRRIERTSLDFVRSLSDHVQWKSRFIGIRGARGTGKTTLLLQRIKQGFRKPGRALYVSLDNLWFARNNLQDLADSFVKRGGTHLFLDEAHKYPQWAQVMKNLYDDYPDLSIVFTGSSLLEILNARADLSRRAVVYTLQGLSFREYLNLTAGTDFPAYSLKEIFSGHEKLSRDIVRRIKPFQYFSAYLETGYYPYFREGLDVYPMRLEETVSMILEIELPLLRQVDIAYVQKLRQLLSIISESAPFIPNVSKLAERIGINRQTLLSYIRYLEEARLTRNLYKEAQGISALQKPDKLFLENTNLMYLFQGSRPDTGNVRETFLANQLAYKHRIEFPPAGDFLVDGKYTIEVGGKSKTQKQITGLKNAWVAADDIEYGYDKKIPLWLFGFLY